MPTIRIDYLVKQFRTPKRQFGRLDARRNSLPVRPTIDYARATGDCRVQIAAHSEAICVI